MQTIGCRLRHILKQRGVTLRRFSEQTGIPYRSLQNYSLDLSKPTADNLAAMAGVGVDLHWLLLGDAGPKHQAVRLIIDDRVVLNGQIIPWSGA